MATDFPPLKFTPSLSDQSLANYSAPLILCTHSPSPPIDHSQPIRDDPLASGPKVPKKKGFKTSNLHKDFLGSLDEFLEKRKNLDGIRPDPDPSEERLAEKGVIYEGKRGEIREGACVREATDFQLSLDECASERGRDPENPAHPRSNSGLVRTRHTKGYSLDFDNPNAPQWPGWGSASPTVIDFAKESPGETQLPSTPDESQYRARRRLSRRLSLEVQKELPPLIRRTHSAPVNNPVIPSSRSSPATQDFSCYEGELDSTIDPLDDTDLDPEFETEPPQWTGGGLPPWLAAPNSNNSSIPPHPPRPASEIQSDHAVTPDSTLASTRAPNIIDFAKLSLDPLGNTDAEQFGVQPGLAADAPQGKWRARRRLSRRLSLEVTKEPDSEMQPAVADLRRSTSAPTGPFFQPSGEDLDATHGYPEDLMNIPEDTDLPRMSIGRRLSSSPRVKSVSGVQFDPKDGYYPAFPKPEPGANAGGWRGAAQWGGSTGGKTTVIDFTDSHLTPPDYYSEAYSQYGTLNNGDNGICENEGEWDKNQTYLHTGRRSTDLWLKVSDTNPDLWDRQEVSAKGGLNHIEKPIGGSLNSGYNLSMGNAMSCSVSRFPDLPT